MGRSDIALIIPALNEAGSIAAVVKAAAAHGLPIVVDDGSADATASLAAGAGAVVLSHAVNRGYDAALGSGFAEAARRGCRLAVTLDADGQHNPALITGFVAAIDAGADVAAGVRDRLPRVAERIFAAYTRACFGLDDPMCGMKAYRLPVHAALGHFDSYNSIGSELLLYAATRGYRIVQLPVPTRERAGAPRFGGMLRANFRILRAMACGIRRYPGAASRPASTTAAATAAPAAAITLLFSSEMVPAPGQAVGFLFEAAPDSSAHKAWPAALLPETLLGTREATKFAAAQLARKLLENEPALRNIRQLGVFEEVVIRELQQLLHARQLHDSLVAHGFRRCVFPQPGPYAALLSWFCARTGSGLVVQAADAPAAGRGAGLWRSWQRLCEGRFSRTALGNEWEQVMARLDPWQRRKRLLPLPHIRRGSLLFYSTAWTFTRIGLLYEAFFPAPFTFLIDNPHTGGLPLTALGRAFHVPARFGSRAMEPAAQELAAARATVRAHLQSVQLDAHEALVRDAFLESRTFANFLERLLPAGLFQSALFERVMQVVQPAAVVVGNPVFEAYALDAARRAGIPTLLLQHGILGDFCQYVDPPADHYIVRGSFWADFLAAPARARARILNPPEPARAVAAAQRNHVLFLTAPYALQELWDPRDLDDILRVLLTVCTQQRVDLVVRVHPLEQVGYYQALVQRLGAETGHMTVVRYSQGAGLEEQMARAAVAVTYSSTAFLDCLRHQVPIVSFGWHEFSYKRQIAAEGVFHFSADLAELGALVQAALQKQLPAYAKATAPFLAPMPAEELRQQLTALVRWSAQP